MCGIVGVYAFAATPRDELADVRRMRDAMIHRGPDDAGLWQDSTHRVVLGHRRLSILDVSAAGRQPMAGADARVQVTFNGEIYNHQVLREELTAAGHVFRSRCDAEALVRGYEQHGVEVVHRLDGMFAFAVWDGRGAGRLVLARDRLGKKPLHYVERDGRLLFASEIRALLAHPDVARDLDPIALDQYLTFGNVPSPRTLFAGIRKLPPASRLVCTPAGTTLERYWSPLDDPAFDRAVTEDEAVAHVRALVRDAVRKRLISDVPLGALLSGGLDSSTNVAIASELTSRPVRTFSIGFAGFGPAENFHDLPHARGVAARFGCDHHEVMVTAEECLAHVPELAAQLDEPLGDPACLPMHFAARAARQGGLVVVLVGEGADEVFAGYDDMVHAVRVGLPRFERVRRLPRRARRALHAFARISRAPAGRIDVLRRALAGEPMYWGLDVAFWDVEKAELLEPAARAAMGPGSAPLVRGYYRELEARRPGADRVQQLSWIELCNRLPELLLARVDRLTMSHSIEARAPFLDPALVSYALALPARLKLRGATTKYVLRRAVADVVPPAVLARRKQGFRVPLPAWLRNELAPWAEHQLRHAAIHRRGLFRTGAIDAMWRRHRAGAFDHSFDLWVLLQLAGWYEHWIERRA